MPIRRYLATIFQQQRELEVEDLGGGRFRLKLPGREPLHVDAWGRGDSLSLLLEGRSVNVGITEEQGRFLVEIGGACLPVEIEDARRAHLPKRQEKAGGRVSLRAPMPGRIARVLVEEGAKVSARQGLIVIEAMKMENELRSPKDGVVVRIIPASKVGAAVEGGEELAIIE